MQLARVPGQPLPLLPVPSPPGPPARRSPRSAPDATAGRRRRARRAAPGRSARPRAPPRSRLPTTHARPGPHQPSSSRAPARTAPTRSGWSGSAASSEASSDTEGPRSTGRMGAEAAAPGRGRKTGPISNSAVSAKPRPTFLASTRNKPGQQRGPQQRLVLAERVGHHDRRTAHVLDRQPEQVRVGPGRERRRQHLDVAGLGQRAADRTAEPLPRRQPPPGQRARHPGRARSRTLPAGSPPRPGRPGR